MLASETAEKPRVKPSQGSSERAAQPQPPAPDALPPELMSDEMHRAAAERSAPWQVRHASRIRIAALVGITGGLAGLALYGWNTLRPSELDKLQITLPARTSTGLVEPAVVPPPPAAVPTATVTPKVVVPTKVQPAPPPQPRVETAIAVRPSGNRTPVTHTRRDPGTPTAAVVAVPAAAASQPQALKSDCAEGVAALGLCK